MFRCCALLLAFVSPLPLPALSGLAAQERAAEPPRTFLRVVERSEAGSEPGSGHGADNQLELLVASYQKGDATLTLFAAVHLADAGFYAELQRRFAACDALLYELVAEHDVRPHPGMIETPWREQDVLELAYRFAARALRCACQVDHIDYRAPTFVHADLTPDELAAAARRAGTSVFGELARAAWAGNSDRATMSAADFVAAWPAGRGVRTLRQVFARVLAQDELGAQDLPVVIVLRNERCLEVLAQQLAAGKKRLGIFYGARHMPHLEARLLRDLGWRRTDEQWLVAWDNGARAVPDVAPGTQQRRWRARREIDVRTAQLQEWLRRNPGKEPAASESGRDPWGRAFAQRACTDGFEVRSAGPDGSFDTSDDVAGAPIAVSSGFLQWLRAQQRRDREHAKSLERVRAAPAREAAAFLRQRELLRVERAEPAIANGPLAAVLGSIDASSARMRGLAVLAVATEYLRTEAAVPALGDLQLAWLPEGGKDPWGAPLRIVEVRAGVLEVRSDGPDGKPGTADDIVVTAPD